MRLVGDRLFVIWRQPSDGTRYVIGELCRGPGGYSFSYRADLPFSEGFRLLAEFPEHRVPPAAYRASHLFPTFAQRVPSPSRPDFRQLTKAWGVEHADDPLEILARSGGIQATDRIELAEFRAENDELDRPLEMRIAGATYHEPPALSPGDVLQLQRESENIYDPHATMFIMLKGSAKIGYVPRQYAKMIARLLDADVSLTAVAVRRLLLPPEGGRWVARVARA